MMEHAITIRGNVIIHMYNAATLLLHSWIQIYTCNFINFHPQFALSTSILNFHFPHQLSLSTIHNLLSLNFHFPHYLPPNFQLLHPSYDLIFVIPYFRGPSIFWVPLSNIFISCWVCFAIASSTPTKIWTNTPPPPPSYGT